MLGVGREMREKLRNFPAGPVDSGALALKPGFRYSQLRSQVFLALPGGILA